VRQRPLSVAPTTRMHQPRGSRPRLLRRIARPNWVSIVAASTLRARAQPNETATSVSPLDQLAGFDVDVQPLQDLRKPHARMRVR
jgi:hypothetical protein